MESKIKWLNWDEELFKDLYKDVVDKVETEKNHMNYKNVNILVLCRQSKAKSKKDKETSEFKEEYKIMTSEVKVYWDSQKETVSFATKNISEQNIFKWCPMFMALPNSEDILWEGLFKVFLKYYQKVMDFTELEPTEDWEEIRKKLGFTSEYKPLYTDGPKIEE